LKITRILEAQGVSTLSEYRKEMVSIWN